MAAYAKQDVSASRDAFVAGRDVYVQVAGNGSGIRTDMEDALRARPIFVQYLNPEVQAAYGRDLLAKQNHRLLAQALHSTRIAILATTYAIVVPASYVFEVPNFSLFMSRISPLTSQGLVAFTCPHSDLSEYRESKIVEYRKDPTNPYVTFKGSSRNTRKLWWMPRFRTTTAIDISTRWANAIVPDGELYDVRKGIVQRWSGQRKIVEDALDLAPQRLDGQAFISRFVCGTIPVTFSRREQVHLDVFLSRAYLESYVSDLDAMMLVDFSDVDLSCGLSERTPGFEDRLISVRTFERTLRWLQIHQYIHEVASWDELLTLREEPAFGLFATQAIKPTNLANLRKAVIQSQKSYRIVTKLSDALSNIHATAETMMA